MKIITAVLTVLAVTSSVSAEPIRKPDIPQGETRQFAVRRIEQRKAGLRSFVRPEEELAGLIVTARWKTTPSGRELIILRDELKVGGHRAFWNFTFNVREGNVHTRGYTLVVKSPEGRLLRSERANAWVKSGEIPPDLVHALAISEVIRGYPFKEGAKTDVRLWVPDGGAPPRMILTVLGAESVDTPAGRYRAWRVNMALDIQDILGKWRGLEFLVKLLVPDYTLWFADNTSKPLVKFEGQFGPKSSAPIEIHELANMEIKGDD